MEASHLPSKNANPVMAIVFPIYLRVQHQNGRVEVCSADQLFDCIAALPDTTQAAIVYPILMADKRGNYTVVRNDSQLKRIMHTNIN